MPACPRSYIQLLPLELLCNLRVISPSIYRICRRLLRFIGGTIISALSVKSFSISCSRLIWILKPDSSIIHVLVKYMAYSYIWKSAGFGFEKLGMVQGRGQGRDRASGIVVSDSFGSLCRTFLGRHKMNLVYYLESGSEGSSGTLFHWINMFNCSSLGTMG